MRTGTATPADPGAEALGALHGRRVEEWIVSTIDDRTSPPAGSDWPESLDRFTPMVRPPGIRVDSPGPSPSPSPVGWARFRLSRRRGVTVVSLSDQALVRERDLDELAGDLGALIEAGHRRLVLDFSGVERLSTWAASTIAGVVRRRPGAEGGAVKVAGVRPGVAPAFAVSGLARVVVACPDVASALEGPWPELPGLRPLPVSVLAALMNAEDARPARPEEPPAMTTTSTRLIIQEGPATGRPVAVRGPRFVIGRGPECHLRLGSSTVSRSHATIERRGASLVLRDLGSTNGTVLNGRPLRDAEAEVVDGDRIRIGPLCFALAVGPEPARPARASYESAMPPGDPSGPTEEFDLDEAGDGLKVEVIEGVLVVTPTVPDLDGEAEIDAFRDALLGLLGRRGPRRVVVDLAHVGHLSSRAIGVLLAHHLRLDRSGGALRVCRAGPRVAAVLEQVRLGMLVECHPSVDEAVVAAWPGSAAGAGAGAQSAGRAT